MITDTFCLRTGLDAGDAEVEKTCHKEFMIEAKWMDNYNRVHEKCCDGVMPRML
jgi:hypothetical protein